MPKSKTIDHGRSIGEMTTTSCSPPANRTQTGRFAPGQSGNPSGRPKRDEDIAALARAHTADAIAALVSIAENPKANDSARISAANSLLDRGHGKPPQAVAVKTDSISDTFVRLWRYLTVGEMVAEAKVVTAGMRKYAAVLGEGVVKVRDEVAALGSRGRLA
jgi:Family of unknown function (DUF5681)